MSPRVTILLLVLAATIALALIPFPSATPPSAKLQPASITAQTDRRPATRPLRRRRPPSTARYVFTALGRPAPSAMSPRPVRPLGALIADPDLLDLPTPEPLVPESLAIEALPYVGRDDAADEIFLIAVNDPAVSPDAHREMIESLASAGLPESPAELTPDDIPLLESRMALLESLAAATDDDDDAAPDAPPDPDAAEAAETLQSLAATHNALSTLATHLTELAEVQSEQQQILAELQEHQLQQQQLQAQQASQPLQPAPPQPPAYIVPIPPQ